MSLKNVLIGTLLFLSLQAAVTHAGRLYSVMPLPLENYDDMGMRGMNDLGHVVGIRRHYKGLPSAVSDGFFWSPETGMIDLGRGVLARALNNDDTVVGRWFDYPGSQPDGAITWTKAGGLKFLATLPGGQVLAGTQSEAIDINNNGQILLRSTYAINADIWVRDKNGTMRLLDKVPFTNDGDVLPTSINQRGDVLGRADVSTGNLPDTHGILWLAGGGMRDIPDLPGGRYGAYIGRMNAAGDISGAGLYEPASSGEAGQRAVLWTHDGHIIDLGTLPSMSSASAAGLNDRGEVVGWSGPGKGAWDSGNAFLWTAKEGMLDLNNFLDPSGLGFRFYSAWAINQSDQILVSGYRGGQHVSAVLTPTVPEPTSALLLLVGTLSVRRPRRS
ncbi:MAG: hypothetical protein NTU53_19335 [Planctomycetota bacterium]|nr:hypothetical protein [Planctomycetota bacterium]